MKILCETQVLNRTTQARTTPRPAKSTLAVGFNQKAKDSNENSKKELEIILFTPQDKTGTRYKVVDNVENIFTKFILDGKATISFRQPPVNLMIKCDPIQLKGFLQTLKLGMQGKDCTNLRLSIAGATAIPKKMQPQVKLVITKRGDYPTKGFPKSLKTLIINNIQLLKVSFDVLSLKHLTVLDLSGNQISKLPAEIGRMPLMSINMNDNALGEANNWDWMKGKELKDSLRDLDLSINKLTFFPLHLIKFGKLVTLKLNNNKLKKIPFGIRRMYSLRFLHLSSNKLESLPSAFNHTRLDLLDVWGNNFMPAITHSMRNQFPTPYSNAPPLWLLAARKVLNDKIPYSSATIPAVLVDILDESPKCPCGKLCFGNSILERAIMVKFINVRNLVFSRDRLIYADEVLCGAKCSGRRQLITDIDDT